MGITHFYIESQNAPLATALIKNGFQLIHSNIALRDAAPGYSFKTAVKDGLVLEKSATIWVDRQYNVNHDSGCPLVTPLDRTQLYPNKYLITNGPNSLISKYFGFSDIIVAGMTSPGSETITENAIRSNLLGTDIIVETFDAKKPPQLGLNAIIETSNTCLLYTSPSPRD